MSKKKYAPVIIKRETVQHWAKSSYIPEPNVIVIMDDPKDGSVKLMIGDGKTNVNLLPDIIGAKIKSNNTEPPLVNEESVLIL